MACGTLAAVGSGNAEALFPRLAGAPAPAPAARPFPVRLRQSVRRAGARAFFRMVQPGTY